MITDRLTPARDLARHLAFMLWAVPLAAVLASAPSASAQWYPNEAVRLSVPFLKQVPPGQWENTMNCGPASAIMCKHYFAGTTPRSADITDADNWLADRYGSHFRNPNGAATSADQLRVLLKDKYGLRSDKKYGSTATDVIRELLNGRPVIVGATIRGGRLSTTGLKHWVVAVGWNPRDRKVLVNDPGTSAGDHYQYPLGDFEATWGTQNKVYIPVYR